MSKNKVKFIKSKSELGVSDTISFIENCRIGVIGLEIYTDTLKRETKVFAGGLLTDLSKEIKTYYINKDSMDNNKVVLDMINEMFLDKYKGITFYCYIFMSSCSIIAKALLDYNNTLEGQKNPFKFDFEFITCLIVKMTIKRFNEHTKKNDIINISDIFILRYSFPHLCYNFFVDTYKGNFPHLFSNQNTLFYVGNTPDFKYYNKDIKKEIYNTLYKENWDFKKECLLYIKKNLQSLYEKIKLIIKNK